MMRLKQKLDKFDTNKLITKKLIKYQNLTVVIKSRALPSSKLFSHFDQSSINHGKIVPMLFYTAYLNGIDCSHQRIIREGHLICQLDYLCTLQRIKVPTLIPGELPNFA
jgi:hypothetical protein